MSRYAIWLTCLLLAACASTGGSGKSSAANETRSMALAKVHTQLAAAYYERMQYGVALEEIRIALDSERDYAPAYNVRALIHMALLELKEAEQDFRHSLQLDAADSETRNNYGWFLCQNGQADASIAHFMAALKNPLYQTPERAWLNAGLCSIQGRHLKEAEQYLTRALQYRPGMPQALLGFAELSFERGEFAAARGYFSRFADAAQDLSASQLWLGIRIARAAGDQNAVASYGLQLRKLYPDARETQLFQYGE